MSQPPCPEHQLTEALRAFERNGGNASAAARELDIPRETLRRRVYQAKKLPQGKTEAMEFMVPLLPPGDFSYAELKQQRMAMFTRKHAAERARRWVPITMKSDAPMALVMLGDPHVDDDGCNWPLLERDTQIICRTPGMLAGNLGDTQNNWVGRLIRLYSKQSTSHSQAWTLVEGWLNELKDNLLFLVRGNHDLWSGSSDPLNWIMRASPALDQAWQAKMELQFPNGEHVRIWVSHDFPGHSQYNDLHGLKKAHLWQQSGAHILGAGHRHIWGLQQFEDTERDRVVSLVRARGYKYIDHYAEELGHGAQQYGAAMTVVITPGAAQDRRFQWFLDVEEAADYLTFKRKKFK